jgi:chromatin structure-remodeling complex protein RSC7
MTDCIENGFTPFATVHENEIVSNAMSNMVPIGRQPGGTNRDSDIIPRSVLSLAPTYTLGGPTTHFAGSGTDPWSEAGWGNKRQKLKSVGVSEEDWMYRTALETRAVDDQLKEYREDRLARLEGRDTLGWVWTVQKIADGVGGDEGKEELESKGEREMTAEWLKPPVPERRRSGLSQEVIQEEEMGEGSGQVDGAVIEDVEMVTDSPKENEREEADIVVQTEEEEAESKAKLAWKAGTWEPGVVRAIIEVSLDEQVTYQS